MVRRGLRGRRGARAARAARGCGRRLAKRRGTGGAPAPLLAATTLSGRAVKKPCNKWCILSSFLMPGQGGRAKTARTWYREDHPVAATGRVPSSLDASCNQHPAFPPLVAGTNTIFTLYIYGISEIRWGDVTAVFSRSRRYHSPERAPKIKYFMSKNMKIIPRKDPRLPPSWTLLGEAPKSDKNRGLHFLCQIV